MEKNVSVLVSTFNNVDYLTECITSIKNQLFDGNIEILLGIDGCEKTLKFVENNVNLFEGVEVFYFNDNSGPFTIKNNLVELSKHELIVFFDSDDIMLPNFINVFFNNISDDYIFRFKFKNFDNWTKKFEKKEEFAWGVFGLTKTTFEKIGYFQNWRCSGDSEYIRRANFFGIQDKSNIELTFLRRVHGESLTMKFGTNFSSDLRKKYHEMIDYQQQGGDWSKSELLKLNYKKIN